MDILVIFLIAILAFLVWGYKHGLETGMCKNCSFHYHKHFHIMSTGRGNPAAGLIYKPYAECPDPYFFENSDRGELSRRLRDLDRLKRLQGLEIPSEECQHCGGTGKVTRERQTFIPFTLGDKITDLLSYLALRNSWK